MPPTSNSVGPTALRISSSFEKLVDGVPNAEGNINSTSTILILSILAQCMLCGAVPSRAPSSSPTFNIIYWRGQIV